MDWQSLSASDILNKFGVSPKKGLNSKEVVSNRNIYGKNILAEKKNKSVIIKFLEQFSDFMVIILLISAAISFITAIIEGNSEYIDSIIILFIVVLNSIIGVVQENKAEKAIEALKKMSSPKARVIRNSVEIRVNSEEVVPGDVILLDTGDFICADARIIESHNLKVEESSLTGESLPVEKDADKTFTSKTPITEMRNMLFATSSVSSGHAVAIVVETGMNTQVGHIARMINEEEAPQTPLQAKLAQTGKYLSIGIMIICFVIFLLGLIQHVNPLEMFMIAISLAVAAIPEGLPAVITIVLAIGVRRLVASRAIIRKLPAVETLGSASVICSDKTGTLTQNKMTVVEVRSPNGKLENSSNDIQNILSFAALCNNSSLSGSFGNWKATGDPTETALIIAAAKIGRIKTVLDEQFRRIAEVPFESERKLMTTIHKLGGDRYRIITKGAPDVLISKCISYKLDNGTHAMTPTLKHKINEQNDEMASKAMRVIAVAYRDVDDLPKISCDIEKNLSFCGLIGMIDPPRVQAKQAVRQCKEAGIKPVMITGDHIITAKAIAGELGILSDGDKALTGAKLDMMSQEEFESEVFNYSVFARVTPEHKVRIVKAFQSHGEVVAMTGDGVNDAPALKAADIGCAMGLSGTDVAKGAADMIMTDDNFSTIVEAVRQGRGIFENIKKTIHFLISTNIGEIITVLAAFLLKIPTPLLAIHLLWINLVTDSLPALALGVEPVDEDIMKNKPVDPKKSLFADGMFYNVMVEGFFIGAISLLAFAIGRTFFDTGSVPIVGRTMSFTVLSLCQLVHAFNVRSENSVFKTGIFGNFKMIYSFIICLVLQVLVVSVPALSIIFKTSCLTPVQWIIVALISLSPLAIVEAEKHINRLKKSGTTASNIIICHKNS